jgi:all-trans-8'-apo-beta-carotenal 15,15'-oxygenase
MDRRQFILSSVGTAALAASGASLLSGAAQANPATFKSQFARAAALDPRLTPFRGAAQDLYCEALSIEGKLPAELRGRFYRNGPANFERGDERYQHWFDGDGMVQQFSFDGKAVSHRGRFVQTPKYKAESQANRFLVPALGTGIRPQIRVTGPDSMNTANTNAIEHAGRVLAMWEGGSAHEMDVATLESKGAVMWREGWEQMPFSAHPKIDPQGNLWNFGTAQNTLLTYQIDAKGKLVKTQASKMPFDRKVAGGMNHDMAITERFFIVPIPPLTLHFDLMAQGKYGEEVMKLHKAEPLRVWIAPKDNTAEGKMFELPHDMVFHVGNAFERRTASGTEIVLNYIGSRSGEFLAGSAVDIMRGVHTSPGESAMRVARFNFESGKATTVTYDKVDEEFPRLDPRYIGREAKYVLSAASWQPATDTNLFHGIQLRNVDSGKLERFDYGNTVTVEEHIVIARPGSDRELDGWIIGTTFDVAKQKTCVNVFNASRIADGPIARAWLPYWLPLGFHGNFTQI